MSAAVDTGAQENRARVAGGPDFGEELGLHFPAGVNLEDPFAALGESVAVCGKDGGAVSGVRLSQEGEAGCRRARRWRMAAV
jgi:hypothetical protein